MVLQDRPLVLGFYARFLLVHPQSPHLFLQNNALRPSHQSQLCLQSLLPRVQDLPQVSQFCLELALLPNPFQSLCSSLQGFVLLRLALHQRLTMHLHRLQVNAKPHKRSLRVLVYR